MVKVVAPCFSLSAVGNLGKAMTFGHNQYGAWVRRHLVKGRRTSPLQKVQRDLFKEWIVEWDAMSGIQQYAWERMAAGSSRTARCTFSRVYLNQKGVQWVNFPWVPVGSRVALWNVSGYGWQHFLGYLYFRYKPWYIALAYQRVQRNLWCGGRFLNSSVPNPTPAQLTNLGSALASADRIKVPAGLGQYFWMRAIGVDGIEGVTQSMNTWPEMNLAYA